MTSLPNSAHRRAVILMIIAPALWSTAGVVTRHLSPELQAAGRFEITFWRSLFAAVFVGGYLLLQHDFIGALRRAGVAGVMSGCMWATMFVSFMLALTLTSTANTLIMLAVAPLVTALLARAVLRTPISPRTWIAIFIAMAGIAAMFAGSLRIESSASVLGMLIALGAPIASAINVVILEEARERGGPGACRISRWCDFRAGNAAVCAAVYCATARCSVACFARVFSARTSLHAARNRSPALIGDRSGVVGTSRSCSRTATCVGRCGRSDYASYTDRRRAGRQCARLERAGCATAFWKRGGQAASSAVPLAANGVRRQRCSPASLARRG